MQHRPDGLQRRHDGGLCGSEPRPGHGGRGGGGSGEAGSRGAIQGVGSGRARPWGRHSHTCTHGPDSRTTDKGMPGHSHTLVHTLTPQALGQADPEGRSPPLPAFRRRPPPPPSLETSLNIYVPQGQPRSAGEPQGGRQLEGRPVACAQGLRRRASGQSKPGPSGAPRRSPTVGCSRLGAGRPPFRACRRHSFICGPFSDSLPADAYLATSVSKYNSRYPPLPGVRSSAAGAAAGRALLGAVGRREEG